MLAALMLFVLGECPTELDLLAVPTPPPAPELARPDLARHLDSKARRTIPDTVLPPVTLGTRGALTAAVRCTGRVRDGGQAGSCEIVVAHLALAEQRLELSGLVGAFAARGRGLAVTGLAARDVMGDAAAEVIVRWRSDEGAWLGLLTWDGFTRVWGPVELASDCGGDAAVTLACSTEPVITVTCGATHERWLWRPERESFVRHREPRP